MRALRGPMTDDLARKLDVGDFLDRYATLLDERNFDQWLDLFTDDCYYTLILHEDYVKETNMVAIGEDKAKLAGRIEVGQNVERLQTTHLLSAVKVEEREARVQAASNFAVIRRGAIYAWGRYHMALVRRDGDFKIERCTAVLNNDVISGTIYLPV